jgi:DNA-binding transcriptional LysR family regulator
VSAALKRLRGAFDDPILVRSGQAMSPRRGRWRRPTLRRCLPSVREMVEGRGSFDPARSQRTFTLMGSDYVQFFLLPRLCERFERQAARVSLEHRPANPDKVQSRMESGQVDLGVGYLVSPPAALRSRACCSGPAGVPDAARPPALAGTFTPAPLCRPAPRGGVAGRRGHVRHAHRRAAALAGHPAPRGAHPALVPGVPT